MMMANTQGKATLPIETESIKIPHKTHTIILSIMFIFRERKIFWGREATGGKQYQVWEVQPKNTPRKSVNHTSV